MRRLLRRQVWRRTPHTVVKPYSHERSFDFLHGSCDAGGAALASLATLEGLCAGEKPSLHASAAFVIKSFFCHRNGSQ